jgi:alpha-glucosidase
MAMLLTLRGSVCLYQGEELGLIEAELSFDQLVDPFGIAFWPEFKGRDGCRTPLPWTNEALGGFTESAQPWLPIAEQQRALAGSEQEWNRHSVLHAYRDFLHVRRNHPELRHGEIEFLYNDETTLTFLRRFKGKCLYVAINTANQDKIFPVELSLLALTLPEAIQSGYVDGNTVVLPSYSILLASVSC